MPAIEFGTTCPAMDENLQTGDIVFPRKAGSVSTWLEMHGLGAAVQIDGVNNMPVYSGYPLESLTANGTVLALAPAPMTVADLLGPQRVRLLKNKLPGYPQTAPKSDAWLTLEMRTARAKGVFDPNDPNHMLMLLKILDATFGDLTEQWLGMNVKTFVRHPVARLLIGAMNQTVGAGFFIGHCGMILREKAGKHHPEGKLFVIEGNITDFSSYAVSISPYYNPDDPAPDAANAGQMTGWVNYRHAMGSKVWKCRPKALDQASPEQARRMREEILVQSKKLLGRPYGFFDHADLGDTDRLYCSEFVLVVLRAVADTLGLPRGDNGAFDIEDRRWWAWLVQNVRDPSFKTELWQTLQAGGLWDRVQNKRFFLYTVQMLWCSAATTGHFKPDGEEYDKA